MPKQKPMPEEGAEPFNLAKLRKGGFEGATRDHLEKAYLLIVGSEATPDQSDEEIARELRDACGIKADSPKAAEKPVEPPKPVASVVKAADRFRIPNLGSENMSNWEGRKRRVALGAVNSAKQNTITLGWDGRSKWTIQVPTEVDMPWPYWENLKGAMYVDDKSDAVRKYEQSEDGGLMLVIKPAIKRPVYQYTDLGDVPGTENLPTSYFEWALAEGERTNVWRGFSRSLLQRIYNILRDYPGSAFFEKKTDLDIRLEIARVLGPVHVEIMDNELYAIDSAKAG